ncbi:hypothetical protein [Nitriliruptor alkaliphilus]|uniref:hypothetical protein n=1 Tax=Nitriliruptor alkaliphilus TaxID=427918 RepID=UPI000698AFA5|nr:hypothetical protein [Nitriliruptor alkaliphilus]
MTRRKRIATVTITGMMALGFLAPAASAQSCVAQGVEFEQGTYGTGFGRDFVSVGARNPSLFGTTSLGEFVGYFATSDHDDCPFE